MYASPEGSADLFHAIPAGITDRFLYVEVDGRRAATVSVLDADRVRAPGSRRSTRRRSARDELMAGGVSRGQAELEIALRACRELGVERGLVPPDFPLAVADHLRARGVELRVDRRGLRRRRRAKTPAQLEGIRRAQRPPTRRWASPRELIHALAPGSPPSRSATRMKALRRARRRAARGRVVAHGAQSAPRPRVRLRRDRAGERSSSTSGRATASRAAGPT